MCPDSLAPFPFHRGNWSSQSCPVQGSGSLEPKF